MTDPGTPHGRRRDAPPTDPADGARLRFAGPADAPVIAGFQAEQWFQAYREVVPGILPDPPGADREEKWRRDLEDGRRGVALAEVAGEVAGVASWKVRTDPGPGVPALELKSMYVAAPFHGTGLAASLLDFSIGDSPASLWVYEVSHRAIAFYRKNGFTELLARKVDPETALPELHLARRPPPPR